METFESFAAGQAGFHDYYHVFNRPNIFSFNFILHSHIYNFQDYGSVYFKFGYFFSLNIIMPIAITMKYIYKKLLVYITHNYKTNRENRKQNNNLCKVHFSSKFQYTNN